MNWKRFVAGVVVAACCCTSVGAAEDIWGLEQGAPDLQSAGPLAFGPSGIVFVGDTKGAAIYAIQTGDKPASPAKANLNIESLGQQLGELLGVDAKEVAVRDLAVNPESGNAVLSVAVGQERKPALVRVDNSGLSKIDLSNVRFAKAAIKDAPEDQPGRRNPRDSAITDMAYVDGKVLLSGRAGEPLKGDRRPPATVREMAFPFSELAGSVQLTIFHGAHGRVENDASLTTFVPFNIDGKPNLLAGFVCTPLVRMPLSSIGKEQQVRGTTVAELGNRNQPLDMIVYQKDGQTYLLIANSARGVMKVSTQNIGREEGIAEPVERGGTAGQTYETLSDWEGVVQLDRLNDDSALIITESDSGLALRTVPLP